MDPGPRSHEGRDVAVGPDREVAARVFGERFDSALITSYDAFGRDVDLREVATLGIVVGPRIEEVLEVVEAQQDAGLWPRRVLLGLPADLSGRDALDAALSRRPSVAVSSVAETSRGLLLTLDDAANVAADDQRRALAKITAHTLAPTARESAGRPRWSSLLLARRRLVALVGGAVLTTTLVLLALLVAIGRSGAGASGVEIVLLVLVLIAQAATLLGTAYGVRLARASRAEQQEDGRVSRERTDRLVTLTGKAASREEQALRDIARLEREILALGRFQSRLRVELRDRS